MGKLTEQSRPNAFEDLIGQNHVLDLFRHQIRSGRRAHAILHGPTGTGKTSGARAYGRALLCSSVTDDASGCGRCQDCCSFSSHEGHPSYREVDCSRYGRIEFIEEEVNRLRLVSPFNPHNVLVLDECQNITPKAWETLLKPLEPDNSSATILLVTTALGQIPCAIASRLEKYEFLPLCFEGALKHLKKLCEREQITYELDALALISSLASGNIRDLVMRLDQVSERTRTVTEADVRRIFRLDYVDVLVRYLKAVLEGDLEQQISTIENWAGVPRQKSDAIQSLLTYLFVTEVLRFRRHDPLMATTTLADRHWIVERMSQRAAARNTHRRQFWQAATDFWDPLPEVTEASLINKIVKFDTFINIDRRLAGDMQTA